MVEQLFNHVRAVNHAVVGQRSGGVRHLQRRVGVVALADTHRHHFGSIPSARGGVFRFGKALGFPFAAGQHAAVFVGQIDTGLPAQIKFGQIGCGFIYAQFITQAVEKGVGRHLNRFAQIGRAVAAAHRIAELVARAGYAPSAGRGHYCALIDFAAFEQRHAHERFESGAGRIQALGNAVDQRALPVFIQAFPGFGVDAVDKKIGVERGLGHKSQHTAGLRINRNNGAAAAVHQPVGFLLQADIHGQAQRLAGVGRHGFEHAHHIAVSIFFHFLIAGCAVKLALIKAFQPRFADMGAAAIKRGEFFFIQLFLVALADAADIAQKVRRQLAVWVFAKGAGIDFHAFEAVKLRRQFGRLIGQQL